MGPYLKKVRRVLQETFPPPDRIELKDEDGVIGVVVSAKFKGLDTMERVDMIWNQLEKRLTHDEARKIVIMIGVTPQEEIAHTS